MRSLEEKVAALATLSLAQLRAEWLKTYRAPAPPFHADLLIRGLAYRLQEKAHGGLSPAAVKTLERLGQQAEATGQIELEQERQIKPGTRLVRSWGDKTWHVTVVEGGFLFQDQHYRSLSRIAQEITGARWSGPRFFGLEAKRGRG